MSNLNVRMLYVTWVLLAAVAGALNAAGAISTLTPGVGQTAPITNLNSSVLVAAPVLAVGQWLLLRSRLRKIGWWVPATLVAFVPSLLVALVGLAVSSAANGYQTPGLTASAIVLGVAWAVVGAGQCLPLIRNRALGLAWIPVSAVAGAASAVGAAAAGGNAAASVPALLLVGVCGGGAYGVVSAAALAWLLASRQPASGPAPASSPPAPSCRRAKVDPPLAGELVPI